MIVHLVGFVLFSKLGTKMIRKRKFKKFKFQTEPRSQFTVLNANKVTNVYDGILPGSM